MTDASPDGFGACESLMPKALVRSMGRWNERWRFRRLPPDEWRPRQRAAGCPFTDIASLLQGDESDLFGEFEANVDFPEVPSGICNPSNWKTVLMGKWNNRSEHIIGNHGRMAYRMRKIRRHAGQPPLPHVKMYEKTYAI